MVVTCVEWSVSKQTQELSSKLWTHVDTISGKAEFKWSKCERNALLTHAEAYLDWTQIGPR